MNYRIPFNRPTAAPGAAAAVAEALRGITIAGNGPLSRRCESRLEAMTGTPRALVTSSCTSALEMAALLLDARPGDEVIVPSFTFVSTANAFAMRGLRPVFADCRPDTFNIDEQALPRLLGPRTRAIVAMHYAGVGCEMDAILDLANRAGLMVIEDNAHGLFGAYKGRPLGRFGALAAQSFHETKNITCGEGGALLVNDEALVDRAEVLREKGTDRSRFFRGQVDRYTWVDLGSNYLLSEIQAAVLGAQLDTWEAAQARRRTAWERYHADLKDWASANGVRLPVVPEHCEHPAHAYFVLLPAADARPRLIEHLQRNGILAVFHYIPLHLSPMGRRFGSAAGDCPVAEDVSERLLRLPLYTDITADEQACVIDAVRRFTC